ncbi:MAG: tetratricopeptide repeat protein [Rudaea sp.]|uniref:tetratricopeptide repeat protein n=1 Tax=Rudaea sp. TaxID=2136325 RepID=UPI0039E3D716
MRRFRCLHAAVRVCRPDPRRSRAQGQGGDREGARDRPELADIDVSESEILVETDHVDEAIAKLEKVLHAHPDHPLAMTWYGDALERAGRMRDAFEWHANIVDRDPYNIALRNNFGTACMMTGQAQKAAEEFRRALEINPDFSDAHWSIALLHRLHGEIAVALDVYGKMQKGSAANGWTAVDQAYAWLEMGDAQKTVDALDRMPGAPLIESIASRSRALCLLDRCKEALRLIESYSPQPAQLNDYLAVQAATLLLERLG